MPLVVVAAAVERVVLLLLLIGSSALPVIVTSAKIRFFTTNNSMSSSSLFSYSSSLARTNSLTNDSKDDAAAADDDDADASTASFTWNEETMSQSLRMVQFDVRGEVVLKADELSSQGREILYTNSGNPHQVGQPPITYHRQVLALCDIPAAHGVDHPKVYAMFPKDVVERARKYRNIIGPPVLVCTYIMVTTLIAIFYEFLSSLTFNTCCHSCFSHSCILIRVVLWLYHQSNL